MFNVPFTALRYDTIQFCPSSIIVRCLLSFPRKGLVIFKGVTIRFYSNTPEIIFYGYGTIQQLHGM